MTAKINTTLRQFAVVSRQRGIGMAEYVLITGFALGALVVPFTLPGEGTSAVCRDMDNGCSAMERLINAVKAEHRGYLYAASVPARPHNPFWTTDPGDNPSPTVGGGYTDNEDDPYYGEPDPDNEPEFTEGSGPSTPLPPGGPPHGGNNGGNGDPSDPGTPPNWGELGDEDNISDWLGHNDGGSGGGGSGGGSGGGGTDPDGPGNGGPAQCMVDNDEPDDGLFPGTGGGGGLFEAGQSTSLASTHVGNPIHVVTGNKYQREIDLKLPGLSFVRHYNSHSRYKGRLGPRWRHSFDVQLLDKGRKLHIWQADGRRIDFTLTRRDDNDRRHFRAAQQTDGTLIAPKRGGYQWHWHNGSIWSFTYNGRLHRYTDPDGRITHFIYGPKGRLAEVNTPDNRSLTFKYNAKGRISTLTDPVGQQITYAYDEEGRLKQTSYSDHTARIYHYEDEIYTNHLTGISLKSTSLSPRGGEGQGEGANLTRIATWHYDEAGRAIYSSHADEVQKVTLEYRDGETRVTNSEGETSIYKTSTNGGIPHVTAIHGPGCSTCGPGDVEYQYNERFQPTRIAYKDGITEVYSYDRFGRTTAIHHQAGDEQRLIARYLYRGEQKHPAAIIAPSVAPERYHAWFVSYDEQGNPGDVIETGWTPDFKGGWVPMQRSYPYSPSPLAGEARRERSEQGRGEGEHIKYDAAGRLVEHTVRGQTLRYEYDARGRLDDLLISAQDGTATATKLTYDAAGRISSVTGPKGTASAEYDAAGRLEAIITPDATRIEFEHDTEDRLQERRLYRDGELLRVEKHRHDANSPDPIDDLKAVQTEYHYDKHGRLSAITDPAGRTTRYQYNAFGQLTSLIKGAGTPYAAARQYEYDAANRLTAITDPKGNTAAVAYDDFGHKLWERTPDAGYVLYRYDEKGRLIATVDEAGTIRVLGNGPGKQQPPVFQTAALSDSASGSPSESSVSTKAGSHKFYVRHRPDGQGRLVEHGDNNQITTYRYDQANRLTEKKVHLPSLDKTFTTSYRYDDNGRLVSKTLPDGQVIEFEYDAQGQITRLEEPRPWWRPDDRLIQFDYDQTGRLASYISSDGRKTEKEYDALGRLKHLSVEDFGNQTYRYNAVGQLEIIEAGESISTYEYDPLGRLSKAITPRGEMHWKYDANGNRIQQTMNGHTVYYRYAPNSNRLLASVSNTVITSEAKQSPELKASSMTTYDYTPTGLPVANGQLRYEYTPEGRVKSVYKGNTRLADYAYNAQGQRIRKTVYDAPSPLRGEGEKHLLSHTTYYLYEYNLLTAELDEAGNTTRQYLYHDHTPIALIEGDQYYAIHTNHRGAPIAVSDEDGAIVWRAEYDPFGTAKVTTPSPLKGEGRGEGENRLSQVAFTLNLRLPGQYYDAETGTHYNLHRSYDPDTGRYLTPDPIGISDGLNTYAYVKNDPLNKYDLYGLYGQDFHYYMTYFLGITAGLDEETATIVALASQYVDDNPNTKPVPPGGPVGLFDRLERYHFTLDYDNGNDGDTSARGADESEESYIRRRFLKPASAQLDRLWRAAMDGPECHSGLKAQLYGEYLHAFEDTFAHRDRRNLPYAVENPEGGIGHALVGHSPDHTYNQYTKPNPRGLAIEWKYNELRTLAAEKAVFESIRADFGVTSQVTWQDLAGDGNADIGVKGKPGYEQAQGVTRVLQKFNAYDPEAPGNSEAGKVEILDNELDRLNQRYLLDLGENPKIPNYDEDAEKLAAQNREDYLGELPPGSLNGVILPRDDQCTVNGKRSTSRGCR